MSDVPDVFIRLPKTLHEQVCQLAAAEGRTVGEHLRALLDLAADVEPEPHDQIPPELREPMQQHRAERSREG